MDLKEVNTKQLIRHPWETIRKDFFLNLLFKNIDGIFKGIDILDVGSGDAYFAKAVVTSFGKKTHIKCLDKEYDKKFLEDKAYPEITYIKENDDQKFDLVLLMDILEHIEDDYEFLKKISLRNLNNKPYLLITVPTWNCLYSNHDRRLGHVRRYSPKSCKTLLENSELEIITSGNLFHVLIIFRLFSKLKEYVTLIFFKKKAKNKDLKDLGNWNHGILFTRCIEFVLKVDNTFWGFFSKMGMPVPGLTFWALCEKKRAKSLNTNS